MRKCSEKHGFFRGKKFVNAYVERDKKKFDFCSYPPAHLVDFPYCHSCEGRNPLFPIEIRTLSRIISLKRADFLVAGIGGLGKTGKRESVLLS